MLFSVDDGGLDKDGDGKVDLAEAAGVNVTAAPVDPEKAAANMYYREVAKIWFLIIVLCRQFDNLEQMEAQSCTTKNSSLGAIVWLEGQKPVFVSYSGLIINAQPIEAPAENDDAEANDEKDKKKKKKKGRKKSEKKDKKKTSKPEALWQLSKIIEFDFLIEKKSCHEAFLEGTKENEEKENDGDKKEKKKKKKKKK